ncbi:bifunctional metallophosphatase/5'-nucleotidase [Halobacterium rubrum]|uniref:bifunctional metallophosphatase/5'-nucleotidase n=1 Tax=Halobacterium TaxID=2239 RepID=UPI001F2AE690|nr:MULTISPECIES: bifunctional UDP-sugar hydrolase/5'-nucleotidase [Halobacterium]MDH5019912.1 bifunctional UDP-sugar hydrolase/5'-nucleotidase [Halobacterium rubrum]
MRTATTVLVASLLVLSAAVGPAGAVAAPTTDASAADAGSTVAADTTVQANNTTVTILSYNDVQTAAAENGTFPRMASLIDERRAAHDNPTFVFGAGDEVSPHSLSPLTQWRTPVDVLNEIQPDAEGIGNHDLDFGFDGVENFSEASEFPWLMANIVDSETGDPIPGTEPYTVVEKQGVKVGVIGLADEKIKGKTAVDFDKQGYKLQDYSEVGSEYATQLKDEENVDVVVALGHFGVPVAKDFANSTDNVDVVLVGDDEQYYPPEETDGVVISEAEARANYVGELNLTVSDGEVADWDGRLISTENSTKDENVSEIIETARGEQLSRVAGQSEVKLDARFASNYHDETNLGNLVTDAFLAETGADVAITNAGGIRSNGQYGPGNITAGDVYNMLPFNNHLVTVELTGSELESLLASQVVTLESETGQQYDAESQLQVGGVTYEWYTHNDTDDPIRSMYVGGEPVDADATYEVTVNSYMAGWDGSVLTNATVVDRDYTLYGTALYDYIESQGTVAPEGEDRIRRVDSEVDAGTVELDGEGDVAVSFEKPTAENETAVDAESFYALNSANERVNASAATVEDGTVSVTFADSELSTLAESGDVEVYGHYSVDGRERPYFEYSVVNADVTAEVLETTTTTTAAPTTTTESAETTAAPETTTSEDDESGSSAPGFGVGAAAIAVLGAALLALRE